MTASNIISRLLGALYIIPWYAWMGKPIFPIYANNNPDYWSNPGDKGNPVHLSDIDNVGYDRRDRREFNGSITLNWEVPWVKGLSAKALLSYDYNNK